ncbi:hypothetical protein JOB18_027697 [Solea senegalensis]|uniref:Uncharacterized protein n=1 Tax=Solea senegalensis TaxID=28829 RepID=A0AAV6RR96_SOLSE|nr:hypothetical protein JOB18_027697 [Solea senegalensis]
MNQWDKDAQSNPEQHQVQAEAALVFRGVCRATAKGQTLTWLRLTITSLQINVVELVTAQLLNNRTITRSRRCDL